MFHQDRRETMDLFIDDVKQMIEQLEQGWMIQNLQAIIGQKVTIQLDETLLNPAIVVSVDGEELSRDYTYLVSEHRIYDQRTNDYLDEMFDLEIFRTIVERTYWEKLMYQYEETFREIASYYDTYENGEVLQRIIEINFSSSLAPVQTEVIRTFAKVYEEEKDLQKEVAQVEKKVDRVIKKERERLEELQMRLKGVKKPSFLNRIKNLFK